MKDFCKIAGCENRAAHRGFCTKHYQSLRKSGELQNERVEKGFAKQHCLEHNSYMSMIGRCYISSNPSYARYGGAGIKVCERWRGPGAFKRFFDDMGSRSVDESLDRIDSTKEYSPDNCKWSTIKEQNRNRKTNIYYSYNGETMVLSDWAKKFNLNPGTVMQRFHKGERGATLFRPSQK